MADNHSFRELAKVIFQKMATWIKSKMMLKVIMTPRQFICDPPKKIS